MLFRFSSLSCCQLYHIIFYAYKTSAKLQIPKFTEEGDFSPTKNLAPELPAMPVCSPAHPSIPCLRNDAAHLHNAGSAAS